MKNLLQAAIRSGRHLTLAIITFVVLVFATLSNQMEMFAMGFLANTGADFFTLFSKERKSGKISSTDSVSLEYIQKKWKEIDKDNNGVISKKDAAIYIAQRKETNPIS